MTSFDIIFNKKGFHLRLLKECNVLISKAFRGQLVISEFAEFTVDVKEIYDKCSPNMTGTPAQYIPQLASNLKYFLKIRNIFNNIRGRPSQVGGQSLYY